METIYRKYLKGINVIQEEEFNKILEILPIDLLDKAFSDLENDSILYGFFENTRNINEVAIDLVNLILQDIIYVFCEDFTVSEASMYISDVDSLEDLEKIKNRFSKIKISNYEEIKKDLEEQEEQRILNDERNGKEAYLEYLRANCNLETIKNIVNTIKNTTESTLNKTQSYAN